MRPGTQPKGTACSPSRRRWTRINWLVILACAVVIASLLGTGALLLSFSGRANDLREAELAAAKLRSQVMGLGRAVRLSRSNGAR